MSKTICVIQARAGSARFPKKVSADLHGKSVLHHVSLRCIGIAGVDEVIVALPRSEQRLFPIERPDRYVLVLDSEMRVGSPEVELMFVPVDVNDVLGRFAWVIGQRPECQTVLRVSSDCPLIDPEVCAQVLERFRSIDGCEYCWTDTHSGQWPDGLDVEVFSRDLLMRAHAEATDPSDREHVTPWMRRHVYVESLPAHPRYSDWPKLSVDTPEDLERVRNWMAVNA
jgi:spore coat polysaccharide biosynthesis protein SpsF